ncbi:uncharacterized protein LOC126740541 isoform X1 [Anthonomus grandis grandis]|uniref:uncharacterized protein LOC126740541 isoform X1 n=2 Tax=Anthonomus grandis grandis TaxID=2921223 RepID=UPI0021650E7F|nr:uncharacterized protein LOC126740541 isoform X1 [Anthonomus grandis grandis]
MSVSDPLVRNIKGCVQHFVNLTNSDNPTTTTIISDNNHHFILFAQTLEKIFEKGFVREQNTKFFNRIVDVFSWMMSISKDTDNFTYQNCVDQVRTRNELGSNEGRFRLLVKYCLVKKCLHVPVETLVTSNHAQIFYSPSSILGDDILTEILLSVLRQVSTMRFQLDLTNASFLDVSWYIPEVVRLELVPCISLGIAISFLENKGVIVNVDENGVAAENGNIMVGDVLDELHGTHINNSCRGRLNFLMRSNRLKPVKLTIIKSYSKESGQFFPPIQSLLKELKMDLESVKRQFEENGNVIGTDRQKSVYGYPVKLLAKVDVGALGNVSQVKKALKSFEEGHHHSKETQTAMTKFDKPAALEIGEIGLKIRDKETTDLIFEHPYMKISSCGNVPILPKVFGYCAGDDTCDVAKTFICYIFEAATLDDADLILQSIGQGFHRTHYAV